MVNLMIADLSDFNFPGTDSMTTCQCVIIRNTGSGAIGLGHFDGVGVEQGINTIVRKVQELSPEQYHYSVDSKQSRYEVYIIGGFVDNHHVSENVAMQILYSLRKQAQVLHLVQACFCELNTDYRQTQNWPIVMGVGVNIKTGQIFPATFHDRGPEIPLRSTVFYSGKEDSKHVMYDIYDCSSGLMQIGPFNYQPMRGELAYLIRYFLYFVVIRARSYYIFSLLLLTYSIFSAVDMWLQQNDESIRQKLSTSPEVEPPHFVLNVRETFKYIQQHPFPLVTVFPDNRPHLFRKDEQGLWVPYSMIQHLY